MPQISIIIPVYNVEKYLNRCIDSVLAQTFSDFELILINDGSKDNSGRICEEYAEKDSRIKVFHQENQGQAKARNVGLDYIFRNSNSEWVTFIDSDDWIHEKYLETLLDAAVKAGAGVSACEYKNSSGENVFFDLAVPEPGIIDSEDFIITQPILSVAPWSKLYKKEFFADMRYPEGKIHEDEFVTYKIILKSIKVAHINSPMYAYYQNPNGTMGSGWSPRKMTFFEAKLERLDFLKSNGFDRAFKYSVEQFPLECCVWIDRIEETKKYGEEIEKIRKMLRVHLKKYKKLAGFNVKNNPWYYENAYPRLMKYYWMFKKKKGN